MKDYCEACGPWWLPGSQKCRKHDPANGSYYDEQTGHRVICHEPPPVMPHNPRCPIFGDVLFGGRPITGPLIKVR